jgi:multiple sugar transport system substrate-binding protein
MSRQQTIIQITCNLFLILILSSCGYIFPTQELTYSPTVNLREMKPVSSETTTPPTPSIPTATITPTSSIKITPEQLNGLTLNFWYALEGNLSTALEELIAQFNNENQWKIKVDAIRQNSVDQLDSAVNNAINITGKIPDITTSYIYQAQNWNVNRDIVLKMNTYIDDPVWGFSDNELSDFYPVFWQSDVISDTRWGLPAWRSGKVLYYNQSWGEELGFSKPPATPEQFSTQACAAAKSLNIDDNKQNDGKGGWIISTDFSSTLAWIYAFGGEPLKPGNNEYTFNTPPVTKTFQFLRKLYDDKCAWITESQLPLTEFANREGLFMIDSIIDIPLVESNFNKSGNPDRWVILPFPSVNNQPVMDVYGPSLVILKTSPQQELAAWIFAKWLLNPENQAMLALAGDTLPLSKTTYNELVNNPSANKTWLSSFDLISYARTEPAIGSWETVRWVVGDASRQLYQWYFEPDQIPIMVKLLNDTANKMHVPQK